MRFALILTLSGLSLSACATVAERTARDSGVGFTTTGAAKQAQPAPEGDYRAALYADMAAAGQ